MSAGPVKRKLAAILAADAFGYSRLMATDEEGTLRLLAAHRAVIDGIIEFHEGRIVNTAGDSVLAEFASPVQAVRCAVEIQDALRTRNDSVPGERRLQFRIGVNLGDVMIRGDDLLGDGVNVAARLESVADPGGICISSSVYDQIAGKLDLGFVDVGPKALKNIDRPVRVYRIERDGGGRRAVVEGRRSRAARWLMGIAAVALLAFAAWHFVVEPQREAAQRAAAEAAAKAAADERARQEALERARAEAEKQRAAAEAARKQAEAETAKRQAEADKQRATAEAARKLAEARAAEAVDAKRALEAQQAAEARARTEAEVTRLRAEAEEARRSAEAARAAVEKARSASPAVPLAPAPATQPVTAPSLREGQWIARIACPSGENFPARNIVTPVSVTGDAIALDEGTPGEPLSVSLRGVINSDGTVLMRGSGVSGRLSGARPLKVAFAARLVGARYEGSGRLGRRECSLVIARAQ